MSQFVKVTEQPSLYRHLEKMSVKELITHINEEDQKVPLAVEKALPQIEKLITAIADKMLAGGRLFYVGAGTSGRLGVLDASECPPTYGVPFGLVQGVIAGGRDAIIRSIEDAEDDTEQAWIDLKNFGISDKDFVVGIAASGTTPYVIGCLHKCRENGVLTGAIACNDNSPMAAEADFPVEVVVGPEFVTGSTRMKSGTAQKLILNMISTTVMIQLGRVEDNTMVHMQLTNDKLVDRGAKMVMDKLGITDYDQAKSLLLKHGSVIKAIEEVRGRQM
ncbi:N-acetylmuramic acid 6-phosphate etherase [Danxiaibacter flavus]|uniref:N-acetylmuramic acid 6-phosphate etherase n=1 Tax=Danxiaibacter flavus TaxID=3049108 RepID=A0ABV3ZC65_9BACT|nr:N-acetylmuramic acid 6-phosphate etherase [Chitinophagaceae bacterium DXS]